MIAPRTVVLLVSRTTGALLTRDDLAEAGLPSCTLLQADSLEEAGSLLEAPPDLAVVDLSAEPDALERLPEALRRVPLVTLSSAEAGPGALSAQAAAHFFLEDLHPRALATGVRGLLLARHQDGEDQQLLLRSFNPAFADLVEMLLAVAPTLARVLLLGETGTGKELLARAVHHASGRKGRFVAINCAAVSKELIEAELFGHVRGAFTGAERTRVGLFQHAHGGTLLLDEVGDMPLEVQAATLRTLEEGRVRPVGSSEEVAVDVRVIAATSVELDRAVARGEFRPDLHYRLNVIRAEVPPLRARPEDIVGLFLHFLRRCGEKHLLSLPEIHPSLPRALLRYPWPGNVRQLANIVERLVLRPRIGRGPLTAEDFDDALSSTERLHRADFARAQVPPRAVLATAPPPPPPAPRTDELEVDVRRPLADLIAELERRYLDAALSANRGRVERTARAAGMSRRTLLRKLKRHGMHRSQQIDPEDLEE
ncbi:MAG: sigma-54 interaction domain-containing protein [Planctomycetota bacterium]